MAVSEAQKAANKRYNEKNKEKVRLVNLLLTSVIMKRIKKLVRHMAGGWREIIITTTPTINIRKV